MKKTEVLIIGAGLTGLLLAYELKKTGKSIKIIEARNRIGGRIHTVLANKETPIEMGATWLSSQHKELFNLLKELQLSVFEQYMKGTALFEPLSTAPPQHVQLPTNQQPSYRIKDGSIAMINKLASFLDKEELVLNEKITDINYVKDSIEVNSLSNTYKADKVVTTVPPFLLVNSINFDPKLPENIHTIAYKTHTWMGDSIKFGVSYKTPFWKKNNYSGTVFSNVGPITELYDHSNYEDTRFALKGFLLSGMSENSLENRKSKVLNQLQKLFGEEATNYVAYEETVWKEESHTSAVSKHFIFPHQNNGHDFYQKGYYDNRFFIGGTETSPQFGGYMEGAVRSASFLYQQLLDK